MTELAPNTECSRAGPSAIENKGGGLPASARTSGYLSSGLLCKDEPVGGVDKPANPVHIQLELVVINTQDFKADHVWHSCVRLAIACDRLNDNTVFEAPSAGLFNGAWTNLALWDREFRCAGAVGGHLHGIHHVMA